MVVTPKERVIAALEHREADVVPTGENQIDNALIEQILGRPVLFNAGWRELEALWSGEREMLVADYCSVHDEIPRALEWDYVRVPTTPADREYRRPEMTGPHSWIDEDGSEVAFNPATGALAVHHRSPDMEIDDLPDPDETPEVDPSELEAIRAVAEAIGDTHFVVARLPVDGTFPWEATVGMEEFLIRMITDPDFVRRAIEVYVNRSIGYIEAALDAGAHAVMTTDDYSDNRSPIMGKPRFEEFIAPALARQCDAVHAKGGYFIKHTDGNTWDLLPSFVEIGIDGWHGIQPAIGMDLRKLKERFGDSLCFFGGVNCETLIEGSPDDARAEVRYAIEHAAPGGGLVVTCGNVLQPGTKLENYLAARNATREFGRYPIES
jgi:uroporphyrinogen decarboxylase